jgi:hypothetical protein
LPLLTVETEVNGDLKRTNERGPFLVGSSGCRAGTRDFCSALAALDGPVKYFFPRRTLFQFLCPHCPASWAGSRAGSPVSIFIKKKQEVPFLKVYLAKDLTRY